MLYFVDQSFGHVLVGGVAHVLHDAVRLGGEFAQAKLHAPIAVATLNWLAVLLAASGQQLERRAFLLRQQLLSPRWSHKLVVLLCLTVNYAVLDGLHPPLFPAEQTG